MPAEQPRVLIYSHDSFGLGHLRRCRAIAHAMVERMGRLSVIILSGSPIIGSFEFRPRVDFVRVPGVIKLSDGAYSSHSLRLGIDDMLKLRASIIEHTADVFAPDLILVDKEPLGLRGEVERTLSMLKARGTRLVLGLRDVMDDPASLAGEWARKDAVRALEELYDEVWIYGHAEVHDPLEGIAVSRRVRNKMLYTGYLRREAPPTDGAVEANPFGAEPFILVTPGGGGDGMELVDWVLHAYEARGRPLFPALVVMGPFMPAEAQSAFKARAEALRDVHLIRFTPVIETLMTQATAIVGMGGYNTFCEILSFDKPTLLVPRVVPRREQAIRAGKAAAAGLVTCLPIDAYPDVTVMSDALARLPGRPAPSRAGVGELLGGLEAINDRAEAILAAPRRAVGAPLSVVR
ncbi:glycosyltransferase family protein [Acuticoccus sp.]|uniref:glycosyltransferase family protein n=1 Tax=Acuticoccus sp. TaxID=1904378 RepID=UPI003B521FC4